MQMKRCLYRPSGLESCLQDVISHNLDFPYIRLEGHEHGKWLQRHFFQELKSMRTPPLLPDSILARFRPSPRTGWDWLQWISCKSLAGTKSFELPIISVLCFFLSVCWTQVYPFPLLICIKRPIACLVLVLLCFEQVNDNSVKHYNLQYTILSCLELKKSDGNI